MTQKPADEPTDSHENQSKNLPQEPYYELTHEEVLSFNDLTKSEMGVLVCIKIQAVSGKVPTTKELSEDLRISRRAVNQAIAGLRAKGRLPESDSPKPRCIESEVRDRLQNQLGGLTEVVTAVGRIDLLTETEVIEVKTVSDWKGALGQVLVYSGFYPNHIKRIHLFGAQKDIGKIADIESACLPFGVLVTFEVVAE